MMLAMHAEADNADDHEHGIHDCEDLREDGGDAIDCSVDPSPS